MGRPSLGGDVEVTDRPNVRAAKLKTRILRYEVVCSLYRIKEPHLVVSTKCVAYTTDYSS